MTENEYEQAIIGGGPAGASLGALLARSGKKVIVLEKETFPRDKLCGEFVSPESRNLLREIGCLEEIIKAGASEFHHARFVTSKGDVLEVPLAGKGLGISRKALDLILWENASRLGAACLGGAAVKAVGANFVQVEISGESRRIEADLVVAAYGKRNALDRDLNRGFIRKRYPYLGLKRHHRARESSAGSRLFYKLDGYVEVYGIGGGYCGVSFVEQGTINVSLLLADRAVRRVRPFNWEILAAYLRGQNRLLGERLDAMEPSGLEFFAEGEIPFVVKEAAKGNVLFIGDSMAMTAPFCGDGIATALRSAELLHSCISGGHSRASLPGIWTRASRAEFAFGIRLGHRLQSVLSSPAASSVSARLLKSFPALTSRLYSATRVNPSPFS